MTAAADQNGPLSIDQAVSLLDQASAPEPSTSREAAPSRKEEQAESGAAGRSDSRDVDETRRAPDGDEAGDPRDAGESAEYPQASETETSESDEGEEEAAETAPRTPRSHWNAEERAIFAKQTPEVQDAILAQEGKREGVLQRAKLDAATAQQAARVREAELGRRVQALDALLQPAFQTFQTRWANIDWSELPERIGADQTLKLRAQFENEQAMIARLVHEQQNAEGERHRSFVANESERLKTEAPDLVDPREGRGRMQALAQFLVSEGFPAERLSMMSAKEAAIAYDAMRWRQAEAKARATPKQAAQRKDNARITAAVVRPTASQPPRTPQSTADDAMRRLTKTGRIDDAVAFLNARSP